MSNTLKKYKLMSVAVLATFGAKSDIIYTDVDPDQTFTENGDEYLLDFDSDGTIDVKISNFSSSTSGSFGPFSFSAQQNAVNIDPYNNGIMAGKYYSFTSSGTNTNTELKAMRANSEISSNQSFISSTTGVLFQFNKGFFGYGGVPIGSNSGYNGNFKDTIYDQFIGVKFKNGSSSYYGWIRAAIQVEQGLQSFTIFDYAYEDSLSTIISGGGIVSPGSLSLEENKIGSKIFVANGLLNIQSKENLNGVVSILDLSGKNVFESTISSSKVMLDINHLKGKSMYIVQVTTKEGIESKKIYID